MDTVSTPVTDQGRLGELEPIGVVDIGSNSVRLVVYEGAVRSPTPLFNEKVLCGLGRNVATTGRLNEDSVERALEALRRFKAIARILGVKNLQVVATAAVREATSGADFIKAAEAAIGARVQVLSGQREAELAANGILLGFHQPDGIAGDLGGGSLELVDIAAGRRASAVTLPLGGLRLIDVTGDRIERAVMVADDELKRVGFAASARGRAFYAVGGTWRTLARLHMEQLDYPLRVMHGYTIPARDALQFCETVRRNARRLKGLDRIARSRRDVVPYGALVMERVLHRLEPDRVTFSVFGIREGLLYSYLTKSEQARDPLLSFCRDYARLRSRSLAHADELCAWTDAIFSEAGPRESPDECRLRHAACLLSDIGWRAHPDYRGEQSLNVVANSAMAGVDHPGRLFIALAIFFRHAGLTSAETGPIVNAFQGIVSRRMQRRARIIAAAVRTAHMLSVGHAGIIDETPLVWRGGRLVLTIPDAYRDLDGERLRRRFSALLAELEVDGEVRAAAG